MQIKYYTLAAVFDPAAGILGTRSMGTFEDHEKAVETAQSLAVRLDLPVDMMACCMDPDDNWTIRYYPDGLKSSGGLINGFHSKRKEEA